MIGRGPALIAQARIDELREGAEADDRSCTYWYLWLLRLAGRIEPMHRLMEAGAYRAAELVIGYHAVREDLAELRSLTEAGYEGAAHELARVARNLGEADVLRELAATGDSWATYLLATLLKLLDDDQLRAEGTTRARGVLAERAIRRGDLAELLAYEDWPNYWGPREAFVKLLVELGMEDELRRRAAQGFRGVRTGLHDLLINQGREAELLGDPDGERTLARRMVDEGRFADLLAWAERGSVVAGEWLWRHLDPGDPYDENRPDWY